MIHAPVTLLDAHLIAMDGAIRINPATVIVTGRFNHEGVSVPMRSRVAVPARFGLGARKLPAVGPQIAPNVVSLEELHEFIRKLYEPVVAVIQRTGVPGGVALEEWVIPILLV